MTGRVDLHGWVWTMWGVAASLPPLWIADQVRNDVTVLVVLACFTLAPVSGTGTGFGPLSSRERGIRLVVLFTRITLPLCGFPPTRE